MKKTLKSHEVINSISEKIQLKKALRQARTDKDKTDVLFAIENDYDFIAMSFVRNKENIAELRDLLEENNASHIKIISKVENQEAIEN